MTTWMKICVPVLLLAGGACALMWWFSPHRDDPDLRYTEIIVKVISVLFYIGSFIAVAIIVIAPFSLKGRIALVFLSIWIPAVAIIEMIAFYWFKYQWKGKKD